MSEYKVLIVEDDAGLREALADTLRAAKFEVAAAGEASEALVCLDREYFGLVISDVHMPTMDGLELLVAIKRRWPDLPVVLITAYATVAKAVTAMREGACDYIVKPFEAPALVEVVRRHAMPRAAPAELIAVDPVSKSLVELAGRIGQSDATVLLTGASGTGKEIYARLIRARSPRAEAPFVAINCAAIPENMLEATLFGYERGAFTGAVSAHPGKFEQAQGGTLMLDEISEMDLSLQAKILRVLQEREVERLGGSRTISLDVRVIATTNRDLLADVGSGRFRGDLYYRLNVLSLHLPELRERPGDILPLAERALAACGRAGASFSAEGRAALLAHPWPGNVRELANAVQRAALLASGDLIGPEALGLAAVGATAPAPSAMTMDVSGPTSGDLAEHALDLGLRERERELILATLRTTAGSRKLAAERLGISARTLRHKLRQLKDAGISVPRARDPLSAEI